MTNLGMRYTVENVIDRQTRAELTRKTTSTFITEEIKSNIKLNIHIEHGKVK